MSQYSSFSQNTPINALHEEVIRHFKKMSSQYPTLHLLINDKLEVSCSGYKLKAKFDNMLSQVDLSTHNRITVYDWELIEGQEKAPVLLIKTWEFKVALDTSIINTPFIVEDPQIVEHLFKTSAHPSIEVAQNTVESQSTVKAETKPESKISVHDILPEKQEVVQQAAEVEMVSDSDDIIVDSCPVAVKPKLTISKLKEYFEFRESEEKMVKNSDVKDLLAKETGVMVFKIQ